MRAFYTVLLLFLSNTIMTFAWYSNLKFKDIPSLSNLGTFSVILVSWGIAFFEYCALIPANRLGFNETGGPFSLVQLKVLQECITLIVFTLINIFIFKTGVLKTNHLIGFAFLIMSVFFLFKE